MNTSPTSTVMRARWCCVLLAVATCATAAARGDSPDQRFMQYLRDRGMYRLAEVYGRDRLADSRLPDRQQVELAIELSLVAVAQAYAAPPGERAAHWQKAQQALAPWVEAPDRPYRLLADLQAQLNLLSRAELERLEQAARQNTEQRQPLRDRLRRALAGLDDVADELERRRRELALGQSRDADEFSDRELSGLERNVSVALARGYHAQGLTYPPNSADRVNALQQAAERLDPIAATDPPDPLAWRARVALAEVLAELGHTDAGLQAVSNWQQQSPPAPHGEELLAVKAGLLLAAGRGDEALAQLNEQPLPPGESEAVDLARLELLLATAPQDAAAIDALLAAIRQRHAARVVRRAETLAGRAFAAASDSAAAEGKLHAAAHFYRAGQLDAAVAAYDEAAQAFRDESDRQAAFAAERSAAAIVQQRRDFAAAAERYRRLALGSLDDDRSAIDHREAVLCLAEVVRQAAADQSDAAYADFVQLCREHLRHWPEGSTTDEVRWWLAQGLAGRGQWQAVRELLEPLPASSAYYEPAMAQLATAYGKLAAAAKSASERRQLVDEAVDRVQPVVVGSGDRVGWPSEWSSAQRTSALELARMKLAGDDPEYAQRMIRAALIGAPAPNEVFRQQATPVLAMALVTAGRTAEAIDLLRDTARRNTSDNLSLESLARQLTERLAEYARSRTPRDTERAAIGQLLLAVLATAGEDTANWQLPAERYRAAALVAVANTDEARTLYEALIERLPRNGDIQEEYARLLASSRQREDREAALAAWSRVESSSRRGSERWTRARRARIELLTNLGRQQEAEKLERLTRLLNGAER